MRITEQEQEIRRDRMLHTAFDLFSKYGIDDVPLARIALEAKVSPKSIYRYFDSKASLLQQTQDILWSEIVDYISNKNQKLIADAENGLTELKVRLYGFEDLYRNHSNYLLFAYEYKAYLIRNEIKLPSGADDATLQKVIPMFLNTIQRGQADGTINTGISAMTLFLRIWYTMRHFVEQLVIYDLIYTDKNPWDNAFSLVIENIIEAIK